MATQNKLGRRVIREPTPSVAALAVAICGMRDVGDWLVRPTVPGMYRDRLGWRLPNLRSLCRASLRPLKSSSKEPPRCSQASDKPTTSCGREQRVARRSCFFSLLHTSLKRASPPFLCLWTKICIKTLLQFPAALPAVESRVGPFKIR